MKRFVVILLLLLIIASLVYRIDAQKSPHELIGELMYFPSGFAMRAVSLGFSAPLADLVWLRFIQYYGEHRMTDARFELMYHILDILTTLDPRFLYAYTLGGLMLTHDAQRPDQARMLLKKGIIENPDDWRLPFIYGFLNYAFLGDYTTARTYFSISSTKPDAPEIAQRWAAFVTYYKLGDLKTALALWIDLHNNTDNPEERTIALYYIEKITMKLDIEYLNSKVHEFQEKFSKLPRDLRELIRSGLVESIPEEPHGEHYYLKAGKAHSTWEDKLPPHMRK